MPVAEQFHRLLLRCTVSLNNSAVFFYRSCSALSNSAFRAVLGWRCAFAGGGVPPGPQDRPDAAADARRAPRLPANPLGLQRAARAADSARSSRVRGSQACSAALPGFLRGQPLCARPGLVAGVPLPVRRMVARDPGAGALKFVPQRWSTPEAWSGRTGPEPHPFEISPRAWGGLYAVDVKSVRASPWSRPRLASKNHWNILESSLGSCFVALRWTVPSIQLTIIQLWTQLLQSAFPKTLTGTKDQVVEFR